MDELSHYLKPPAQAPRRFWLGAGVLFPLAIWVSSQAYVQHVNASLTMQTIEQIRAAQAARPAPKVNRAEADEQKRWNALKAERDFTWLPLFHAIESAASANIELLEFRPDKGSRRVQLRGEALDRKALTAYLEALALQPAFTNVHLTHQQDKARDRLHTIEFEIKATLAQ